MTDSELLNLAVAFDAGPLPISGRWIIPEGLSDDPADRVRVEHRGKGWVIVNGGRRLHPERGWIDHGLNSERSDEFIAETNWPTARGALMFYRAWRMAVVEWATEAGIKEWVS